MGNKKKTTGKKKTARVSPKAKKPTAKKASAVKKSNSAKKTTASAKKKQLAPKAKVKSTKSTVVKSKTAAKVKKTAIKAVKEAKKPVKGKPKSSESTTLSGVGAVVGKIKKVVEKAKKISVKDLKKKAEPTKVSKEEVVEDLDVDILDEDQANENPEGKSAIEVILTDAEGRQYCRRRDCDQIAMVEGYCRYHYLLFWKKIQQRKKILTDGKLVNYIEELTARYPDKYLDMIKRDLKTEKDFLAAIQELEIDESNNEDSEYDDDNSILDEVRGMSDTHHSRDDDDY